MTGRRPWEDDAAAAAPAAAAAAASAPAVFPARRRAESQKELSLRRRNYAMPTRWGIDRTGWGVKVCWVAAHVFCVALIVALNSDLRRQTLSLSWFAGAYYVLLIITFVQYYYTAGSSPGYVSDAIEEDENFEEQAKSALDATLSNRLSLGRAPSIIRQVKYGGVPEDNGNGNSVWINVSDTTPLLAPLVGSNDQAKTSSRVSFCNNSILYSQPSFPTESRWYVLFETLLVLWTTFMYGSAMGSDDPENWLLHDTIVLAILLGLMGCLAFLVTLLLFHTYLAITNQTTYEKTRQRRIPYLRNLPDGIAPFSRGCKTNIKSFCCTPADTYPIYTLPSVEEIEAARARSCMCCG